MNIRKRHGFTLIELMVVIVIIGILGTIVVGSFIGEDEKAKVTVAKTSTQVIHEAVLRFKYRVQYYPETLQELITGPADYEGNWQTLLVGGESSLKDPWKNEYEMFEDDNGEITIISYGADGEEGPGTKEFDVDITYPRTDEE